MNEGQVNKTTPVKESEFKDLGLGWVNCPHNQEEVRSIERALVEATARVYSESKPPVGKVPDFIILCPNEEGVPSGVRRVRAVVSDAPVLVFYSPHEPQLAKESIQARASGLLYSGMGPELIARTLSAASRDEILISRELLEAFLEERKSREDLVLSSRQREFLELVVISATFEEIKVHKELLEAFLVGGRIS